MPQDAALGAQLRHFKPMVTLEPFGACETKPDTLPRLVFFDEVAERTIAARSADSQVGIELHGGPRAFWPERVTARRQRIDECSGACRAGRQLTFVDV